MAERTAAKQVEQETAKTTVKLAIAMQGRTAETAKTATKVGK
jgi:hypothetical protein